MAPSDDGGELGTRVVVAEEDATTRVTTTRATKDESGLDGVSRVDTTTNVEKTATAVTTTDAASGVRTTETTRRERRHQHHHEHAWTERRKEYVEAETRGWRRGAQEDDSDIEYEKDITSAAAVQERWRNQSERKPGNGLFPRRGAAASRRYGLDSDLSSESSYTTHLKAGFGMGGE
jgi:hypothetical protein